MKTWDQQQYTFIFVLNLELKHRSGACLKCCYHKHTSFVHNGESISRCRPASLPSLVFTLTDNMNTKHCVCVCVFSILNRNKPDLFLNTIAINFQYSQACLERQMGNGASYCVARPFKGDNCAWLYRIQSSKYSSL